MSAHILVTKPGALNAADKELLRKNGVVVVESETPNDVRYLVPEEQPLTGNQLFYAAMEAIAKSTYSDTSVKFAAAMHAMCKANGAP